MNLLLSGAACTPQLTFIAVCSTIGPAHRRPRTSQRSINIYTVSHLYWKIGHLWHILMNSVCTTFIHSDWNTGEMYDDVQCLCYIHTFCHLTGTQERCAVMYNVCTTFIQSDWNTGEMCGDVQCLHYIHTVWLEHRRDVWWCTMFALHSYILPPD